MSENFCASKDTNEKVKRKYVKWKELQIIYLIRILYSEYIEIY